MLFRPFLRSRPIWRSKAAFTHSWCEANTTSEPDVSWCHLLYIQPSSLSAQDAFHILTMRATLLSAFIVRT
jgi:hypothetical protein